MSKENVDRVWKVFTVVLGAIILPLAGWVWNTNIAVTQLQNDLRDAEETIVILRDKLEDADANAKAIISMEKDIEYMKETLDRIERLVAQ